MSHRHGVGRSAPGIWWTRRRENGPSCRSWKPSAAVWRWPSRTAGTAAPLIQNIFPLVKMPRLSEVDLSCSISEETYKEELKRLQNCLGELHNRLYRKRVPVVIVYEGWGRGGKGRQHQASDGERWIPEAMRVHPHRQPGAEGEGQTLPVEILDQTAKDGAYRHF